MRRTIPLIVLALALLALAACSPSLPLPEAPVPPAAEPQAVEAPAAPAEALLPEQFVGIYAASLPAADSPGREVTVELAADGSAVVTSDYQNNQPPIVETGAWSGDASGAASVALTAQDGQPYFEPNVFTLALDGEELVVSDEAGRVARFARTAVAAAEPVAAVVPTAAAPAVVMGDKITTTETLTTSGGMTATMITVTQTVTVTAPGTAGAAAVSLGNTYLALLPAASGGGTRLVALTLFDDGAAQLATEFANEETPLVELGSWVDNGDDTFTVTLTGRPDGAYDAPIAVTFQRDGDAVQSIDQQELYGSEGLHLRLAAEVARAADASLVSIDLDAGFPLDPTFVSVQGGGEVDVSLLSSECVGFVNRQPVVTLNWTGEAPFVETFFVSDSDPTLLVLTPDGRLLCNDDANDDLLDPVVEISDPVTGTYKIWVGSYAKNQLIPGVLVLTTKPEVNIGTFNLGALIQRPLVAEVQPAAKRVATADKAMAAIRAMGADSTTLAPGDKPVSVSLTVSGTIPLFELGLPDPACNGLVSGVPDFVFNWAGDGAPFSVFFEGDSDATLLVLSEDAQLLACGDDAETDVNINPVVAVAEAKSGLYGVWIGRINPEQPVAGVLTVSTVADATPKPLGPVQ
ncbi:MAG: copper resistance protein NlpE N-terminal domain-containing protein [Anaerolinea sp.]|nr:copper resistance protein NlpE N-terminal domain-containing protein [Anaerolinea sp.]